MTEFNRRSMFGVSLGAGAMLAGAGAPAEAQGAVDRNPYTRERGEEWIIDDTSAVAETETGKVAGYIRDGVRVFMGIPYAEMLTPEGRWQRGTKTRAWTGTRTAFSQGWACPMGLTPQQFAIAAQGPGLDEAGLRDVDAFAFRQGEDCLRLNIWTPALDNKKRPVLFWCHGGGFHNGAGLGSGRMDGTNLARYGDVVIVSFNHRLNALGFLDLTPYGARYAESANLGMLDAVDALKWVQRNIANFGGDAGNVMIFGQSGGGCKVATLLTMPEARGLFHRAVMESASPMPLATPEQAAERTAFFLKSVGVAPGNIAALHKLSVDAMMAGSNAVRTAMASLGERFDTAARNNDWRPVVDGRTVPHDPLAPTGPSNVPLMAGNNLHEGYTAMGHPEYFHMPEAQAREPVRAFYGPPGDAIYDIYKNMFPQANPYEISATSRVLGRYRAHALRIAQRRAALGSAPSYNYWLHWRPANFGGRTMSYHELEVPLVYLNVNEVPWATGNDAAAKAMSIKLADVWLAFARTGNPNTPALPKWDPVTATTVTSMFFNNESRIDHGSDMAAVDLYLKSRFPNG